MKTVVTKETIVPILFTIVAALVSIGGSPVQGSQFGDERQEIDIQDNNEKYLTGFLGYRPVAYSHVNTASQDH